MVTAAAPYFRVLTIAKLELLYAGLRPETPWSPNSKRLKVFTDANPEGRFVYAFRRSTGSEQFRVGVPYDSGPSPPRLSLTAS